jgi:hypothetical protein
MTGTRPVLKTTAFERRVPWPLPSIAAYANALGMIAPKTGMDSVYSLKTICETRRHQRPWTEPAA